MLSFADFAGNLGDGLRDFAVELASIWLLVQLLLILLAGIVGTVVARQVNRRIDLAELTAAWPLYLRLFLRLVTENLGTIIFILLLVVARSALLLITPVPAHSYLVAVAASLATAWVVIALLAGVIRNQFLTRVVAISAWTLAALSILGLLAPTMATLDSVGIVVGGLRITPLLVIKTSILLLLTLWAAMALSDFLERRIRTAADLTPSIQVLLCKLIRLLLLTFAILIVLSTVGIDFSTLAFFSGAIGVGIGFGLQKIVSNLVSGIILLADKSIKPGDVISVGEHFGRVGNMGARYTSVDTRDGREYLIPNEDFITQRVANWTYSSDYVRLSVNFNATYDSDPREVQKIAIATVLGMERVSQKPAPACMVTAFGSTAVEFEMWFWIRDPAAGVANVKSDLLLALWDALDKPPARLAKPGPARVIYEMAEPPKSTGTKRTAKPKRGAAFPR